MSKKLENEVADYSPYIKKLIEKERAFKENHPIRLKLRNLRYSIKRTYIAFIDFFLYDIKAYYQRVRYGVAQRDVWGFDYYLANVIIRGLKQLKSEINGCPNEEKMTLKKWETILQQMIIGFETQLKVDDEARVRTKKEEKIISRGWQLFVKYFNSLWD